MARKLSKPWKDTQKFLKRGMSFLIGIFTNIVLLSLIHKLTLLVDRWKTKAMKIMLNSIYNLPLKDGLVHNFLSLSS